MKEKVSIIICAYNEQKSIEHVVTACCEFNPESEVIVVNDGSTDNTGSILRELQTKYGFKYEELSENKGKSWAMARGVELSTRDVILFWDADVLNIKKEHFDRILSPLFEDVADMVIGLPTDILIDYRINPFNSLSGERAVWKKDILPILDDIRHTRFGVETYINLYYQVQGKRVEYVLLEGLHHMIKYKKSSPTQATKAFISEGLEIATTLLQNYDMIVKILQNRVEQKGNSVKQNLLELQDKLNKKIQNLLNRIKTQG